MKDGSWLKLLPRATTTQHSWSRTELYGLKGLLKMVCKYATEGPGCSKTGRNRAWGNKDSHKNSPKTAVTQGVLPERCYKFSKINHLLVCFGVGLVFFVLFWFFFQKQGSIFFLHFHYGKWTTHTTLETFPFPWRIYQTFLDKAGEVGCIRVSILEWQIFAEE